MEAHPRITNIIPVIKNDTIREGGENITPDINLNMEDLFKDFFIKKNKIPPSEEILNLFRELAAMQSEDSE